ncbi:MAG TPA: response regulator [Vicinamibacterales bacterium]|jgi:PAS domain S-box-containing protein|nr:response regulator [Vicinamibacterales bacterium]
MTWLAGGVLYSVAYLVAGSYLRGNATSLVWLRIGALLIPPLVGIVIIARRRQEWRGCQWLFWATIALGLSTTAIGIVGWTVDEMLLEHETSWLGWYTVFALFGSIAPLFAMLAQPHRGTRESSTASTAVDIAGIAVMTGFLYSHFVVGSNLSPLTTREPSLPLVLLHELQQLLVFAALAVAALASRGSTWAATYRRLALGLLVSFTILTISNLGILQGLYRSGGVYDVIWILPFAFFAWAAASAPGSLDDEQTAANHPVTPSRPWVVFGSLATLPILDFGLRQVVPIDPSLEGFRDLSMVITIFSVLPLLMARLAVENADAQHADRRRLLLAAATEQAGDLISIMTPSGDIEYANAAFCRALGFESDEVSQMTATDFLSRESHPQLDAIRAELPRHVWRGTFVRRRKDGSTFQSATSVVALTDAAGQVTNFVAVERDTTHEAQLRDQLIHSERLAAVGQLVSGVAHELNNPLQSIVGFTDLLMASERRPEVRSDLEQVHAAAGRAAKIVHNLLAFVRRSSTERRPASLNDVVQSTVSLRRYELVTTGLAVDETYEDHLPPVLVNPEEIQQIILNIVLNAEQAMRTAARGRLSVRTLRASATEIAVEIYDDGPGVPQALAGRIFEPFFSTKDVGEGTGLGLSLALGIAEAHGGGLTLVPTTSGACFRLTLPIAPLTDQAKTDASSQALAVAAVNGRRALVVDDEPALRRMLQRLLTRRGFTVDLAEDGDRASSLLERHRYDVIFSDVQMPNMGGLALLQWIRQRQPASASAFVFVMGGLVTPELQSAIESSRIPVLSKPFGAASFDALLGDLFSAA